MSSYKTFLQCLLKYFFSSISHTVWDVLHQWSLALEKRSTNRQPSIAVSHPAIAAKPRATKNHTLSVIKARAMRSFNFHTHTCIYTHHVLQLSYSYAMSYIRSVSGIGWLVGYKLHVLMMHAITDLHFFQIITDLHRILAPLTFLGKKYKKMKESRSGS